jgi:hypothetical protein
MGLRLCRGKRRVVKEIGSFVLLIKGERWKHEELGMPCT